MCFTVNLYSGMLTEMLGTGKHRASFQEMSVLSVRVAPRDGDVMVSVVRTLFRRCLIVEFGASE